ncbi:Uncharacterised protein [Raoultella terrigena]|uniref:YqhI domain-containing protein n=1 Tax=Raoultella terrigena TaxID=577 RepID=A0A4U9D279_RAOTE|nr:Uncharacterised protein [Raoultella terrigena]
MTRLTAKDFPQQLLEYYDYYAHGKISKREFLQLAGKYAVGGMTALALFNLLKPNYALAEQVVFTDPDIRRSIFTIPLRTVMARCAHTW